MNKQLLMIMVTLLVFFNASGTIIYRVAKSGTADFKSIQAAINALPVSNEPAVIYIAAGTYNEKLYLERSMVSLIGSSAASTIITAAIARDEWRCTSNDDWGVATLNIKANDISLQHLTIENNFAETIKEAYRIECPNDTAASYKEITARSHQMALRTQHCTRLRATNCHFRGRGGDTVSPWEVKEGMWYFKDCIMEGGVDLYCPRGWAWAENCRFIVHGGTAAIWHDGSANEDSKTVLLNCSFSGYDGFLLGRYHRDAQFYLINCSFANNMRDSAIYRVPTQNIIQWGHRVYYFDCSRPAGNYTWFANNISAEEAKRITPRWLFKGRWLPEQSTP